MEALDGRKAIPYSPDLIIRNLDQLSRGRGMPYLEVIRSHIAGEYIARKWRRRPVVGTVVIAF